MSAKLVYICVVLNTNLASKYPIFGINKVLSHHTRKRAFKTIHAEMDAISKIYHLMKKNNKTKIKIDILVILITRNRELKMSRPCYHCIRKLSKLKHIVINNVYYSNSSGTISKEKLSHMINNTTYLSKAHRHFNYS